MSAVWVCCQAVSVIVVGLLPGLLDPKWMEERQRSMAEKQEQEEVLAAGSDIDVSLKQLAERRTDIFGIGTEETQIGKKVSAFFCSPSTTTRGFKKASLSLFLSVSLSISLCVSLSISLSLSVSLSCFSLSLSLHLSFSVSFPISLSLCLCLCLSVCLSLIFATTVVESVLTSMLTWQRIIMPC